MATIMGHYANTSSPGNTQLALPPSLPSSYIQSQRHLPPISLAPRGGEAFPGQSAGVRLQPGCVCRLTCNRKDWNGPFRLLRASSSECIGVIRRSEHLSLRKPVLIHFSNALGVRGDSNRSFCGKKDGFSRVRSGQGKGGGLSGSWSRGGAGVRGAYGGGWLGKGPTDTGRSGPCKARAALRDESDPSDREGRVGPDEQGSGRESKATGAKSQQAEPGLPPVERGSADGLKPRTTGEQQGSQGVGPAGWVPAGGGAGRWTNEKGSGTDPEARKAFEQPTRSGVIPAASGSGNEPRARTAKDQQDRKGVRPTGGGSWHRKGAEEAQEKGSGAGARAQGAGQWVSPVDRGSAESWQGGGANERGPRRESQARSAGEERAAEGVGSSDRGFRNGQTVGANERAPRSEPKARNAWEAQARQGVGPTERGSRSGPGGGANERDANRGPGGGSSERGLRSRQGSEARERGYRREPTNRSPQMRQQGSRKPGGKEGPEGVRREFGGFEDRVRRDDGGRPQAKAKQPTIPREDWGEEVEAAPWGIEGDGEGEVIGDGGFVLDPWIEAAKAGNKGVMAAREREARARIRRSKAKPPPREGAIYGNPTWVPPKRRQSTEEKNRREYVYGPYGPYRWRGRVIGKGTKYPPLTQPLVVNFSTVRDDREQEQINQYEMNCEYERELATMDDENIGIKHFFAFVRKRGGKAAPEAPWEDWTLVAQIGVESKEDPDRWTLPTFLTMAVRSKLTQCVAWSRPDLIYVKRPGFQVRFEPQPEFFGPIIELLDPLPDPAYHWPTTGAPKTPHSQSLYGQILRILRVSPEADQKTIVTAYKEAEDRVQSRVWKLVFESHPTSPLRPLRPPKPQPKPDSSRNGPGFDPRSDSRLSQTHRMGSEGETKASGEDSWGGSGPGMVRREGVGSGLDRDGARGEAGLGEGRGGGGVAGSGPARGRWEAVGDGVWWNGEVNGGRLEDGRSDGMGGGVSVGQVESKAGVEGNGVGHEVTAEEVGVEAWGLSEMVEEMGRGRGSDGEEDEGWDGREREEDSSSDWVVEDDEEKEEWERLVEKLMAEGNAANRGYKGEGEGIDDAVEDEDDEVFYEGDSEEDEEYEAADSEEDGEGGQGGGMGRVAMESGAEESYEGSQKQGEGGEAFLRAAVCPFDYTRLLIEMTFLRKRLESARKEEWADA